MNQISSFFKVVVGFDSGCIQIYDQNLAFFNSIYAHDSTVNRVKLLPNGFVATASIDSTVKIWDPNNNWNLIQNYTGHSKGVNGLEYINNDTMASCSADFTIKIWSISTGKTNLSIITQDPLGKTYFCQSLKLLINGIYIATGGKYDATWIYNINDGSLVTGFQEINGNNASNSGQIEDLILIDYNTLATSSSGNTVAIWDLTKFTTKFILQNHTNSVYGLKLVSSNILASASLDNTIKLWNLTTGNVIRTLANQTGGIYYAIDLFNQQTILSGFSDGSIAFWDLIMGQLVYKITTTFDKLKSLANLNSTAQSNLFSFSSIKFI